MLVIDKDGVEIYRGLQVSLMTKDVLKNIEPEVFGNNRDDYIQMSEVSAAKYVKKIPNIKELAGEVWDDLHVLMERLKS